MNNKLDAALADYKQALANDSKSDAAYNKVTLPFNEVNGSNGVLREDRNLNHEKFLDKTMMNWSQMMPDLRGFYRDKAGNLKLLTSPN